MIPEQEHCDKIALRVQQQGLPLVQSFEEGLVTS